jgi:hypothetical protein
MADLSSCYFCGAAMDASLREHAVVPAAFAPTPDRQTTVVLCGTCERKLERVLDPVVDAAAAQRRAAANDPPGSDVAGTGNATTTGTDASAGDDATGATADDDPAANLPPGGLLGDDDESGGDADGEPANPGDDGSSAAVDGTPFEVDDTASVFDDGADETASDSVFADETDVPRTTIPDAEAGDDDDGIAFDDQSTDRTPDGDETGTNQSRERPTATGSDATDATDATETTAGGSNASAGADADSEPDAPDVDPRTYNKVVRLLKNRDLPVARSEIESIAGSAYDIPDHECEAIVDAAIQRGLVAEDGSELTYPDGV